MAKNLTWQADLSAFLFDCSNTPFEWGKLDCALFAASAALLQCGTDPAQTYRGRYKTERGAKQALTRQHGSLEAAFDACFKRVDPAFAQRGDIVLFEGDYGKTCGVYWAGHIWAMADSGCRQMEADIILAWRVE